MLDVVLPRERLLAVRHPHELEYVYGRKEKGWSAWKLTDDLF